MIETIYIKYTTTSLKSNPVIMLNFNVWAASKRLLEKGLALLGRRFHDVLVPLELLVVKTALVQQLAYCGLRILVLVPLRRAKQVKSLEW